MTQTNEILKKRNRLQSEEKKLMSDLEDETIALESTLKSSLKTLAVISAGALAAAALYSFFSENEPEQKTRKSGSKQNKSAQRSTSPVTTSLVSLLIQKLLPVALEKLSLVNSKDSGS